MTSAQSDIIRGTADMLILKLLDIETMHGWGLGQAMQRRSRDALRIQPGALYAALHRLTRDAGSAPSGASLKTDSVRATTD